MFFEAIVDLDRELVQPLLHLRFEDVAEIDFGEPQVAVAVALDVLQPLEILFGHVEDDALGNHRHAVLAPLAQPLDDRAGRACRRWS